MKTYVADLYFDHVPDPAALVRATAEAFAVPSSTVAEGWFLGDTTRAAYDNPLIRIIWLRNYTQSGQFPVMYGLAIENGEPESETHADRLAAITGKLGIAAVMPTMYGKMRLFGPDGSNRVVLRDDDANDDIIRLSSADRAALDRAYRASQPVAS